MTRVSAIIVHFGPWEPTGRALASLRSTNPSLEIVVVNNGGIDPAEAERAAGPDVTVLSPGRNLGYGAACNLGAGRTSGGYLLVANNDVEFRTGTVGALVATLDRDPGTAAVGPELTDSQGRPTLSVGLAPTPRRILFENLYLPRLLPGLPFFQGHHTVRIDRGRAQDVETVLGALILLRRSAFDQVGGFDERYFLYGEESDLFSRLRQRGWRIRFEPASSAVHHGGLASRSVPQSVLDRWLHESLLLYARDHHGPSGEQSARRALLLGTWLRWALAQFQRGPIGEARRRRYADILAAHGRPRPPGGGNETPRA